MTAVQQTPQIMEQTENEASGLRILVADDNMDAADSLALLLRLDGHEVAVEYNGVTALARFHSRSRMRPCSISACPMTGYELAKEYANSRRTGNYLVAVSGWGAARAKQLPPCWIRLSSVSRQIRCASELSVARWPIGLVRPDMSSENTHPCVP